MANIIMDAHLLSSTS